MSHSPHFVKRSEVAKNFENSHPRIFSEKPGKNRLFGEKKKEENGYETDGEKDDAVIDAKDAGTDDKRAMKKTMKQTTKKATMRPPKEK